MKKWFGFFAFFLLFVSCSSVVVPNYIVDYSDKGREERRLEEERLAAEREERKKIRLQEDEESRSSMPHYIAKKEFTVERDKCIRIVQISDFHSAMFGSNEDTLIQKIKDASPDLIVLTGDIFDFAVAHLRIQIFFIARDQNVRRNIDENLAVIGDVFSIPFADAVKH